MLKASVLIPSPCHESWAAMTPTGAGRHCAACQKTVVDFTQKTDAEILAYLASAAGETCGRLGRDQQNRPLLPALVIPARPAARWRAWLALALAAWGLRAAPAAAADTRAASATSARHPRKKPSLKLRPAPKLLRGTVRDATTHEPLADVAVFLKGENRSATTDAAGCFSLPLPAQRPRTGRALVLHYTGYQSETVAVPTTPAAALQLVLQADPAAAGATIVGYAVQHRQDITGGVVVVTRPEVLPLEERRARSFWQRITQPFRK